MENVAIKVEHLTKVYPLYNSRKDRLKEALHPLRKKYHRDYYALNDVSFEVYKGETVGIIGKNGSGKSTLLKILSGVLTPTSGAFTINGKVSSLLELGTGFSPELTGIENVYFYGMLLGFTKKEMDDMLDDILSFADIGDFVYQPVKSYSSGMYVRLAFSVAVNVKPDILIVDEALAVGDIRFQVKCYRKFQDFQERGKTIIFVSHAMSEVARLCQRAIWLNDGGIKKIGDAKKVTEEYSAWMIHDTGVLKVDVISDKIKNDIPDSGKLKLVSIPKNAMITGEGGVEVEGIGFFDEKGELISTLTKEQWVKIVYRFVARTYIQHPFLSFQVINRKGIIILANRNIYLNKVINPIEENQKVQVSFDFFFPEIENDQYLIAFGINDGYDDKHIRLFFIMDAYQFEYNSRSVYQKQLGLIKLKECHYMIEYVK